MLNVIAFVVVGGVIVVLQKTCTIIDLIDFQLTQRMLSVFRVTLFLLFVAGTSPQIFPQYHTPPKSSRSENLDS